ncbi:MAG: calcium/sodium antiporter [Pseudomonadota bacterium]
MIDIVMIVGGLALLFGGGEMLVKGAVALAQHFGLSPILVSAVVIGFGTSMPEMTVSVEAALKNAPDIAIGNVVGSNIANVLLIMGMAGLVVPIAIPKDTGHRDTIVMIVASLALCTLALWGVISALIGFVFVTSLIGFIAWSCHIDKKRETTPDTDDMTALGWPRAWGYVLGGFGLLLVGAYVLIEGSVAIARHFDISEAIIGLTIVALGTSLPELAASLVAASRKQGAVIIGNIIGSNIFNILAILGVSAMITPIPIAKHITLYDVWIMAGVILYFSFFLLRKITIGRINAFIMLGSYCFYILWLTLSSL